ncbi:MAG: LysM peptidoglycan-binding domain-containing protein [Candidatus Methylomirabilales bacterium]
MWESNGAQKPLTSHMPPLALAIPRPPTSLITATDVLFGDPVLAQARELIRQAKRQAEMGRDHEAIMLLTRARDLLRSDGASLTPEVTRRRAETLKEVKALSEELAAIQAMTEIPFEGEGSLITPEDLSVLEQAIPEISPPVKPEISYDVPIELNQKVEAYIELFTTKKRNEIAKAMERSGRYLPLMREIFAEKGLPLDLVHLAYIESSFKLYAYSRARAAGLWQFIRGTGRKYGLTTNWWVDERRDPVKASAAAADYLSDLYEIFESWPLAIAAYNSGEGKVKRAIRRQRTTNFWKLKLPRETRYYVPAFMAMTIIAKDPEEYGFEPPVEQPWQVDQVALPQPTDLRLLAKAAGMSTKELKELNPELRRLVTPPQDDYFLNLPPGSKATFLEALEQLPQVRRVVWRQHRIRRGEALSTIARRYRTTVTVLMEMNHLKNPNRIRAGTRITVPVPAFTVAQTPNTTRPSKNEKMSSFSSSYSSSHYVVRRGDTLWDIARAHRVSTEDLKQWNNLNGSRIYPGHTLRIHADAPQARQVTWRRHRVRRGETLSTIAQRYGTTVAVLMKMNHLQNPHRLRAGTRIAVPVPTEGPGPQAL